MEQTVTPEANTVFNMSQVHHTGGEPKIYLIGLLVLLIALVVYLVLRKYRPSPAVQTASPVGPGLDNLAPEREKVLKLLDAGKITAQESAELLNALGSAAPRPAQMPLAASPHRKLVLIGGALLLVGFFLPWFSINLDHEMARVMGQLQQSVPQTFNSIQFPGILHVGTSNLAGGDIHDGLGWWVLFLGSVAVLLPYVAGNLKAQTLHTVALIGLGIGSAVLVYLLSEYLRYISVGILLALAGYVLEIFGTIRQRPAVQR